MERIKPVHLRLTDADLELIAEEEGFVGYAYDDADPKRVKTPITAANAHTVKGTLTGAYGHTRTVAPGDTFTREQGLALLRQDVREAESLVHRHVDVPLTRGEFVGTVDLFYNVGPGRRKGSLGPEDEGKNGIACLGKEDGRPSTLLRTLNAGDYEGAAACFTQWRMPGSIFEDGLTARRIRKMLVFMGLPVTRAALAFPNVMPKTPQGVHALTQASIALARQEAEDAAVVRGPAPEPKPEILLNEPLPPAPVKVEPAPVIVAAPKPVPPAPNPVPAAPPPPPPPPPKPDDPPVATELPRYVPPAPVVPGPVAPTLPPAPPNMKRLDKTRRYWGLAIFHGGRFLMILGATTLPGHFAISFGHIYGAVVADPALFSTVVNALALTTGFVMDVVGKFVHNLGGRRADSVMVAGNEPPGVVGR